MYKLLALDIDGTLLTSGKLVSARTRSSLDAARAAGVRLVLVTGRRYPAAQRVVEMLGGDIPLVLHNGALVVEGGCVRRCRPLPLQDARKVIEIPRLRLPWFPTGHARRAAVGEGVRRSNTCSLYLDSASRRTSCRISPRARGDPIHQLFGGSVEAMDALLPRLQQRSRRRCASSAPSTARRRGHPRVLHAE